MAAMWDEYLYRGTGVHWKAAQFIDQVFRGIGQLTFVENTQGGIALTALLAYFAPFTGACVVAGSALSVLWAHVIGADKAQIRSGLVAFNGILVVAGTPLFINPVAAVVMIQVFGSLIATFIHDRGCKHLSFPLLTMPFVITEVGALSLTKVPGLGPQPNFPFQTQVPSFDHVGELFSSAEGFATKLVQAVPLSITQLCFTSGPTVTFGALFCGLLLALDRRVCEAALIGGTIGCTFGLIYGYEASPMLLMFGLNSALCGMALYPTFGGNRFTAVAGATLCALIYPGFIYLTNVAGVLAFTAPFCAATIPIIVFHLFKK